jgi:hypothetical protein
MTDRWLNMKEASTYTGFCIRTLERAVVARKLRSGGILGKSGQVTRRFKVEHLDAFVMSGGKVTARA